jgi:flagellar FliL protein
MTMTNEETSAAEGVAPPPRQLSTFHFILIVTALTLAAAGAGFLSGLQILSSAEKTVATKGGEPPPLGGLQHVDSANVKPLSPIVTNLAGSPPVWIRLEASLVFHENSEGADALAAHISEDIVGFLRTVSVAQLEGAIGFQHLSEDLNDRVRVRSNGRVRELVIQGLIIE